MILFLIGNLDEKVSERVLYEILIQVGHVVDLHIPRDKETNRHKGYAFAEYETEETANYAVRLFSGLVRLHNKTLKFAVRCFILSFHTPVLLLFEVLLPLCWFFQHILLSNAN